MVWKGTKVLAKIFYVRSNTESDETARCFDYECVASDNVHFPDTMFNVLADVGHQFTQLSAQDRAEGMLATEISKTHPDFPLHWRRRCRLFPGAQDLVRRGLEGLASGQAGLRQGLPQDFSLSDVQLRA